MSNENFSITYFKVSQLTGLTSEITVDQAKDYLKLYDYPLQFLNEIFEKRLSFRLLYHYGYIYTKVDNLVPMAGFFGVL